jgi:xanthine dehydrogenase/oxidase
MHSIQLLVTTAGTIIFGGIRRGPVSCTRTVAALIGTVLSSQTLVAALPILQAECTPAPDAPPTTFVLESAAYRQSCATTLFYRFALAHWFALLPPRLVSAATPYQRPVSSGVQVFSSDPSEAPVDQPIPKLAGLIQCAGEAKYSNDQPLLPGTLYAAYAVSTEASAALVSIDASEALALPGVVAFVSARSIADIGGTNSCGMFPGDEEVRRSVPVQNGCVRFYRDTLILTCFLMTFPFFFVSPGICEH